MGLHGVAAVEVRSRARAARDGLVVLQPLVAEGQVVHGSLGGGENPERAVEGIHDALRSLDVPGSHRGRRPGVEERPRRNHELEGLEAALVQRNRPLDERAEHIQHRRRAHRARRVEVVCALGRGANAISRTPQAAEIAIALTRTRKRRVATIAVRSTTTVVGSTRTPPMDAAPVYEEDLDVPAYLRQGKLLN